MCGVFLACFGKKKPRGQFISAPADAHKPEFRIPGLSEDDLRSLRDVAHKRHLATQHLRLEIARVAKQSLEGQK